MNTRVRDAGTRSFFALALAVLTSAEATAQEQLFKLEAFGGTWGDQFGTSVSISGDRTVVGSHQDIYAGISSGSARLFEVSTGQELFMLLPSDAANGDQFGFSVAIDGNHAVAGAWANADNGPFSGSAYAFDVRTGQQLHKLLSADNASGDCFGLDVAISGDRIVVGAPGDTVHGSWSGSAYVFDAVTGSELTKLVPSDGAPGVSFGCSVAVSGDRAVVGAFYDDDNGLWSGSAYIFDIATGQELFKLLATDGAQEDNFGRRVAVDGNLAVIGAWQDDDLGSDSGSAYIFDVTTGLQLHKLLPDDGTTNNGFGSGVSISGELAVIGAMGCGYPGASIGCGYAFDAATGQQFLELIANDPEDGAELGWSAGVSEGRAILGAPSIDSNRGAAYLFDLDPLGTGYCFGDPGSGIPCLCGNDNDGTVPGSGCANGAFVSGAQLTGTGKASVGNDSLVLITTGMEPNNPGLYFQANNAVNGGDGNHFGDGLRCAGGELIRLQVRTADAAGTSSTTIAIGAKGGVSSGETKRYQCWYRNPTGSVCGHDFNLSNGYEIAWRP